MNPFSIMQMKTLFEKFQNNHPRVFQFFQAASVMVEPGSVIEVTVTNPQGKTISTNMKVTEEDLQLLNQLKNLGSN